VLQTKDKTERFSRSYTNYRSFHLKSSNLQGDGPKCTSTLQPNTHSVKVHRKYRDTCPAFVHIGPRRRKTIIVYNRGFSLHVLSIFWHRRNASCCQGESKLKINRYVFRRLLQHWNFQEEKGTIAVRWPVRLWTSFPCKVCNYCPLVLSRQPLLQCKHML